MTAPCRGKDSVKNPAARIVAIYALLSVSWILLSDRLLHLAVSDQALFTTISVAKGWAFVLITAWLLYLLINKGCAELQRAGHDATKSGKLLQNVLETLPVGVWLIDRNGAITQANPAGRRIWGDARLVGIERYGEFKGWWLASGKPIEALEWGAARAIMKGESSLNEEIEIEAFDGSRKIILHSAVPLRDERQEISGAIVVNQDITERKRAEGKILEYQEQLRSLASELLLTEERERREIATTLHDYIGQTLAITQIKLGELRAADPHQVTRQVDEIRGLIDQTIRYSRSLTFELSPPILYELGLEAAICSLCEKFREQHGIPVECVYDQEHKPMNDDIRVLLFQAVRELLVNVGKHARARSVRVTSSKEDDAIRITVADDGIGLNAAENGVRLRKGHGFGLFSIRERLRYFGGSIEIESAAGHGTRVTLTAPLAEAARGSEGSG